MKEHDIVWAKGQHLARGYVVYTDETHAHVRWLKEPAIPRQEASARGLTTPWRKEHLLVISQT